MTYVLGHDQHGHQITSVNGCSGTITIPVDGEHDDAANIFAIFDAEYTDAGGLTTHTQYTLQPRHRQAEHYKTSSGIATFDKAPAEGGKTVGNIENGDWIGFTPYRVGNVDLVHRPGLLGRCRRHRPDPRRLAHRHRARAGHRAGHRRLGRLHHGHRHGVRRTHRHHHALPDLRRWHRVALRPGRVHPEHRHRHAGQRHRADQGPGRQVSGRAQRRHRRRHPGPDPHLQRWDRTDLDGDPERPDQGVGQVPGRLRRWHRQRHEDPALDLHRWHPAGLVGADRRHPAQPGLGQVPGRLRQQLRRQHRGPLWTCSGAANQKWTLP